MLFGAIHDFFYVDQAPTMFQFIFHLNCVSCYITIKVEKESGMFISHHKEHAISTVFFRLPGSRFTSK